MHISRHGDRIGTGRTAVVDRAGPTADLPTSVWHSVAKGNALAFHILTSRTADRVGRAGYRISALSCMAQDQGVTYRSGGCGVDGYGSNRPIVPGRRGPTHRHRTARGLFRAGCSPQVSHVSGIPQLCLVRANCQFVRRRTGTQKDMIEDKLIAIQPSQFYTWRGAVVIGASRCPQGRALIHPGKVGRSGHDAIGYGTGEGNRHRSRLSTRRGKQAVDR